MYVKNYNFTYNLNNRPTQFVMTALKGHLLQLNFEGGINKDWNNYPIEQVFHTAVTKGVSENSEALANNLRSEVRSADILFIWTDCDREGEAIGGDVADICRRIKPNITVWRARFSAMQPNEIHQAAQHHATLDMRQVEAVRTRAELDFRIGAAFTRLQTIHLRSYFNTGDGRGKVLSYGSCQFPTLGFVVDRYMQIENFIPEEFWKITMTHVQPREDANMAPLKTVFNWRRERLFDRWACFVLYEKCFEKKVATVTKVKSKSTSKWKPLPLTTVELQKVACRVLNMSGHQIMSVAEGLYNQGLISYPRTETDQYDAGFDFRSLIELQIPDRIWGQYAQLQVLYICIKKSI
jgi:DNA topoisomerase-3